MKAAIIGAGAIAREHLACLKTLKGVRIVAVCDRSPAAAESTAEQFAVEHWFTSHKKMLQQVQPDVVHVTTPVNTHYGLAADALEHGCHTIVEKPITTNLDQLEQLCESARRAGRLLVEDHNYLFNNTVQKILHLIDTGRTGPVVHVEAAICLNLTGPGSAFADPNVPHPTRSLAGGAIGDFLTHLSSLVHVFLGPHSRVTAHWSKRRADSPLAYDHLCALIETSRGTATLMFHGDVQPEAFWVRVTATRMRAEAHLFEPRLTIERLRGGPGPFTPLLNGLDVARAEARAAIAGLRRKLSPGPGSYEGLWELLRRTYTAIDGGTSPPVTTEQIRAVNRLAHALTDDITPSECSDRPLRDSEPSAAVAAARPQRGDGPTGQ